MSFRRAAVVLATTIGLATALAGCGIDWKHIPPTPPSDQSKFGP